MPTLEAYIFDCDGFVVDSAQLQKDAEQQTAPEFAETHGLDFDPDNIEWDEMEGWARKKIAANIYGVDAASEVADKFRLAVVDATVEIASLENLQLISEVTDFRNYLAMHGLILGLATSSNRLIYNRYCELFPMDFYNPNFIVTQGECGKDKPEPDPFRELMYRMGVAPERTGIGEDSSSGITAARLSGGLAQGVAHTKSVEFLLSNTGAHLVAADFREAAYQLQPYLPR